MNPRTVCFCQPICAVISTSVAPFFRWSMATTWAVLLPSRGPSAFGFVAFLGALAGCLAAFGALSFLVAFGLTGATRRACFAPLAFVGAFGSWVSVLGAACASSVVFASFSIVFMALLLGR